MRDPTEFMLSRTQLFFIPVCPRNVFLMHAFVFPQISHTSTAPRWKASLTRSLPSSSWPTENKTMKIVEERNLLLRYALSFERSQIAEPRSHFPANPSYLSVFEENTLGRNPGSGKANQYPETGAGRDNRAGTPDQTSYIIGAPNPYLYHLNHTSRGIDSVPALVLALHSMPCGIETRPSFSVHVRIHMWAAKERTSVRDRG